MQAPPLYHTTGEVLDVISTPGLERMARFLAYFVKEVAKAPLSEIKPAAAAPRSPRSAAHASGPYASEFCDRRSAPVRRA